ncbi:hypothetical protein [Defluviimonas sp. SAOS-178_SWC]|uniref:hypothetical protein n=1 Tax=Defluviimonas sp. SAOS-178_SWC TaxID=3121287 RepID=UPI003221E17E
MDGDFHSRGCACDDPRIGQSDPMSTPKAVAIALAQIQPATRHHAARQRDCTVPVRGGASPRPFRT